MHVKRALNPALGIDQPPGAVPAEPFFGARGHPVLLDESGRVDGLAVTHRDRSRTVLRARVYVLALNAIENAKVLLMSAGERAPNGVANGSDIVGRYLMDHDVKITYARAPVPLYPFRGPLSSAGVESLRAGPFRAHRGAFRIELQNTGWSWATNSPFSVVTDLVGQGLTGRRLRESIAAAVSSQIELNGLIEPEPDPENTVRPSATLVDGLGVPRPELRYRVGAYATAGGAAFLRAARAVYRALGATEPAEVPGWQGAGHLMGTHRMGTDPSASCDDVRPPHEHPNLYLAGAGLFPTVDAANPTPDHRGLALRTAATSSATTRPRRTGGREMVTVRWPTPRSVPGASCSGGRPSRPNWNTACACSTCSPRQL